MNCLKCVSKFYDDKTDYTWAWFQVIEDGGIVYHADFKMPVNDDDFFVGEYYSITWKHLLKMD